jgi:hypothetical protein
MDVLSCLWEPFSSFAEINHDFAVLKWINLRDRLRVSLNVILVIIKVFIILSPDLLAEICKEWLSFLDKFV